MACISRVVAPAYPRHVTQPRVRSIPIFQIDTDRMASLDFMAGRVGPLWCRGSRLVLGMRDRSLLELVDDWGEYLKGNDEPGIQTMLLRGIRTGRPAGSKEFVKMIERLTGRDLEMRKAGRPLHYEKLVLCPRNFSPFHQRIVTNVVQMFEPASAH